MRIYQVSGKVGWSRKRSPRAQRAIFAIKNNVDLERPAKAEIQYSRESYMFSTGGSTRWERNVMRIYQVGKKRHEDLRIYQVGNKRHEDLPGGKETS